MERMLAAESTILLELKTIRSILLLLHSIVVALFALCACERDLNSHYRHLHMYLQLMLPASLQACVLKKVHTKKEPAIKR
jgi:hypothetical protein